MKKVFSIMAIAAMFAACTNESTTETTTEDSIRIADSIRKAEEDAMKMQQDNLADTLNKKADSLDAKAESLRK